MTDSKPTPNDRQIRSSLSPHAQAVFWEFNRAASGKPDDWHYLPAIAAALRAVADQLFETEKLPPGYVYSAPAEMWYYEFLLEAHGKLLAIAAELEGSDD
jgi:hypothetical protein